MVFVFNIKIFKNSKNQAPISNLLIYRILRSMDWNLSVRGAGGFGISKIGICMLKLNLKIPSYLDNSV